MSRSISRLLAGLCCCMALSALAADPLTQAMGTAKAADAAARAGQQRIDRLDDQTQKMLQSYRAAVWQTQQLTAYADGLQPLLDAQQQQIARLDQQLSGASDLAQRLQPLLLQMVDSLARFVQLDLPFLRDERSERIANLRRDLADPSLPLAEKFRRIAQAYRVEADYGRTLGAEREDIRLDGASRTVDVLRVGRLVLLYETLDGADTGYWDPDRRTWISLGGRNASEIAEGLRIARRQVAAAPLVLPLPTPAAASSSGSGPQP